MGGLRGDRRGSEHPEGEPGLDVRMQAFNIPEDLPEPKRPGGAL